MTDPEFKNFISAHLSNFPACLSWLSKFPKEPRGELDVTQRQVMDSWRRTLRDVALEDAIAASDALASGSETFSEKAGFDHHPRDIRRICLGRSSERISKAKTSRRLHLQGEETYRCPHCHDQGYRTIIHEQSISAARTLTVSSTGERIPMLHHPMLNPEGRHQLYSQLVACTCQAGNNWTESTGRRIRPTDAEWQLGSEENYQAALTGAERQREAETNSYAWEPADDGYDAYADTP